MVRPEFHCRSLQHLSVLSYWTLSSASPQYHNCLIDWLTAGFNARLSTWRISVHANRFHWLRSLALARRSTGVCNYSLPYEINKKQDKPRLTPSAYDTVIYLMVVRKNKRLYFPKCTTRTLDQRSCMSAVIRYSYKIFGQVCESYSSESIASCSFSLT